MQRSDNVLRVNSVEEQAAYRSAVARIIGNIMRDHDATLIDIAEKIDVSTGTISNAVNRKTDLSATYLQRIGQAYGPHVLDPYAALSGGRIVAIEADDADAIVPLSASIHRIAVAQSPGSEGGDAITHRELLDMLPDLIAAQKAISGLIMRAERIAA